MTYADIIYKSLHYFHNYNQIEKNEEKLLAIVNKNRTSLKSLINNYINDYYNNYTNFNILFKDDYLKKLIKNHTIYNEMAILIENKNKEIYELKQKIAIYESK
jgi:hypothetical protein